MKFFDGLYGYEIVILVLGVCLFLAALIKFVKEKKPNAGLIAFFLVSLGMIGYPSWQSIEYKDGVFSIQKKVHDLQADPGNEALRASLQQEVSKVETRPSSTPEANLAVAQAHFALGNEAVAKEKLDAALQKAPESADAKELKSRIELSDKLTALTAKAESAPNDTTTKAQLDQAVKQAAQIKFANPNSLRTVNKAQSILRAEPIHH
jgi:hypothetical protein